MRIRDLHPWQLERHEAIALQQRLAAQVVPEGLPGPVRRVAGVDISVDREGHGRGAVVVLSYPELEPLELQLAEMQVPFPYIPGLLAFREVPVLLPAFQRLEEAPDLILVDGQGIAHFRRFGIACHLGLLLDTPTIGCAKSRLCGSHGPLGEEEGSYALLEEGGEVLGLALRTRRQTSPLYISVGHRIGLTEAQEWVLRLCRGYRLPEPTRLAHAAAGGQWHPTKSPLSRGPRQWRPGLAAASKQGRKAFRPYIAARA